MASKPPEYEKRPEPAGYLERNLGKLGAFAGNAKILHAVTQSDMPHDEAARRIMKGIALGGDPNGRLCRPKKYGPTPVAAAAGMLNENAVNILLQHEADPAKTGKPPLGAELDAMKWLAMTLDESRARENASAIQVIADQLIRAGANPYQVHGAESAIDIEARNVPNPELQFIRQTYEQHLAREQQADVEMEAGRDGPGL